MDVVDVWTGRHANALRRALRLTIEGFASSLGTAPRTVAKWNAEPNLEPVVDLQRALDTVLQRASADERARFALFLAQDQSLPTQRQEAGVPQHNEQHPADEVELRLTQDRDVSQALAWLDEHARWPPGESRRRVSSLVAAIDPRRIQDQGRRRGALDRTAVAEALHTYYGTPPDDLGFFSAECDGRRIETTILTRDSWLDLAPEPDSDLDGLHFSGEHSAGVTLDPPSATAAAQRLSEVVTVGMRLVNAPIYLLRQLQVQERQIRGAVAIADFVSYALTMDLLENELLDALASSKEPAKDQLPLRSYYLPDIASVLNFQERVCAGGPLALFAVARRGRRGRRSREDYLLLVQERSGRVLNAAQRLAVIPKCFHEPMVDYGDDADLVSTLEREMEEELFGRDDVDSTHGGHRHADPMHRSRLSPPMRWLDEHRDGGHWRIESTGVGINLVSGNYEFPHLIVIDDPEWWDVFGGSIEANWESTSLRRYSTLDRQFVTNLVHDPAWSNEGLFAFLLGIRRLAAVGGARVDLPTIELENSSG